MALEIFFHISFKFLKWGLNPGFISNKSTHYLWRGEENLNLISHSLGGFILQGPPNSFFYLKVQSFRLIMENNFLQMAALAGHAVAYTIGPIFYHIIDCVQLYFSNGFANIVL